MLKKPIWSAIETTLFYYYGDSTTGQVWYQPSFGESFLGDHPSGGFFEGSSFWGLSFGDHPWGDHQSEDHPLGYLPSGDHPSETKRDVSEASSQVKVGNMR